MIAIHLASWTCQWVLARPTLTGTCWLQGGLRTSANRHSNNVRGSQGLVSYVTAGHGLKLPMLGNCSGSVTVAELEELTRSPTHPLFWTLRHSISVGHWYSCEPQVFCVLLKEIMCSIPYRNAREQYSIGSESYATSRPWTHSVSRN